MKTLRKLIKNIILVAVIFILLTGCVTAQNKKAVQHNKFYNIKNNIECIYYNPLDFINIKQFDLHEGGCVIRGSILPHHLLASDLIHEVFQNVSNQHYETVVLIGPDHESILMGKIFTTLKDWQTPFGVLNTDLSVARELLKNGFLLEDDEKLTIEHSISSIVPFVKYYLNDAKIVSLAMTKQTKLEDIEKLIDDLSNLVDLDKTLFISSVDFSHYLDLDNANQMDSISMEAIENKNINKIMSFTNDNLDSPVSIVTMLKMMDKLYEVDVHMINHSNSELITKQRMDETTSYITYLFY